LRRESNLFNADNIGSSVGVNNDDDSDLDEGKPQAALSSQDQDKANTSLNEDHKRKSKGAREGDFDKNHAILLRRAWDKTFDPL
jgi:hypothetical protein